jgi:hypothetical protein
LASKLFPGAAFMFVRFCGGGPFLRCRQKWGFFRGPFHAKTAFIHEGKVSPRRAMLSAGVRVLRPFVSQVPIF